MVGLQALVSAIRHGNRLCEDAVQLLEDLVSITRDNNRLLKKLLDERELGPGAVSDETGDQT